METKITLRRTYSIVTEESAAEGGFAENGWLTEGGQEWPAPVADEGWKEGRERATATFDTVEEAAAFIESTGSTEWAGRWWSGTQEESAETDAGVSGVRTVDIHPDDETPEETVATLRRLLAARGTSYDPEAVKVES